MIMGIQNKVLMRPINYWSITELQIGWQVCEVTTLHKGEQEGFRCGTVEWIGEGLADEDRVFVEESDIRTYVAQKLKETGDAEEWDIQYILKFRLIPMVRLRLPDGDIFYWYNAGFRRIDSGVLEDLEQK